MVCTGYMVETRTLTYQCHYVTVLSGVKKTNGDSLASIDWILASAGDGGGSMVGWGAPRAKSTCK